MSKEREAKAKVEADNVKRARAWTEAKAKEKAEIARVNDKARERARVEDGERVREKYNDVQRAAVKARRWRGKKSNSTGRVAVEDVAKIKANDDI